MLINISNRLLFNGTAFPHPASAIILSTLLPLLFAPISSSPQTILSECQLKNSFGRNKKHQTHNIICFKSRESEPAFMFIGAYTNIFLAGNVTWSITECSSCSSKVNCCFEGDWRSFIYAIFNELHSEENRSSGHELWILNQERSDMVGKWQE